MTKLQELHIWVGALYQGLSLSQVAGWWSAGNGNNIQVLGIYAGQNMDLWPQDHFGALQTYVVTHPREMRSAELDSLEELYTAIPTLQQIFTNTWMSALMLNWPTTFHGGPIEREDHGPFTSQHKLGFRYWQVGNSSKVMSTVGTLVVNMYLHHNTWWKRAMSGRPFGQELDEQPFGQELNEHHLAKDWVSSEPDKMCQQSTAEPANCHFRRGQISKKAPRCPGQILSEAGDMIWGDKREGNERADGAVVNVQDRIAGFPEVPGSIPSLGSLKRESCDGQKSAGWHDSSGRPVFRILLPLNLVQILSRFVWCDLVKNWVHSEQITAEAATFPLLLDYLSRYFTKVVIDGFSFGTPF
ncbi:hypothetical protein C8Q79DRAFT_922051 [Trametes meyenii]|nr:hypothetical protein C8Q79DRAFT_922051 [Trametes meyenii]